MVKNLEISVLLDFYGGILTEKQYSMINYYYNEDLSLSEIAQNEGITRQGVRDTIKRGETILFDMEEKLSLCEKAKTNTKHVEHISELSKQIIDFNLRYNGSREIDKAAKEIELIAEKITEV